MADNSDDINMDDGGVAAPAPKKGGLGGLLSGVLKWVIIAVGAVILIVVVVVVTMKIASKNTGAASNLPISEEYTAQREILDWYTSHRSHASQDMHLSHVMQQHVMRFRQLFV